MADPWGKLKRIKSELEDRLTCPLCHDIYHEPHQLPCGHSFCKVCLENLPRLNLFFICSECRTCTFSLPLFKKCYTLTHIVEDFRKTLQAERAAIVYCDSCLSRANQRRAVRTCLQCEASLCAWHTHHHEKHPVFHKHLLLEPACNLSQITCPEHAELVLKSYCPVSRKYICSICTAEKQESDLIKQKINLSESAFKKNMENSSIVFEKRVQFSVDSFRDLRNDVKDNTQRGQSVGSGSNFNFINLILLLLGLIVSIHALDRYRKYHNLHSTIQNQKSHLQNIFSHLSDRECFLLSQGYSGAQCKTRELINVVTLDLDSASPFLKVSPDLHSVERVKEKQPLPVHRSRFTQTPQVLSIQCFSSGRLYWEIETEGYWDVAVSYKRIQRRLKDFFGRNQNSWSLTHKGEGTLLVSHNRKEWTLSRSLRYSRVAVAVDFQRGTISFSEVGRKLGLLYEFRANLTQPVCLGFGLYRSDPPSRVSIVKTSFS